tara:strand:+ start:305 stop:418 length:114 start_codon:yes stop_codon:yes gene_type:complete
VSPPELSLPQYLLVKTILVQLQQTVRFGAGAVMVVAS